MPPLYAQKRDSNEADIVAALRSVGAMIRFLHEPCDLLVGFQGRWFLMEVKANEAKAKADERGQNKTQRTQRAFREEAQFHGCPAPVVWTSEMALAAIGAIKEET